MKDSSPFVPDEETLRFALDHQDADVRSLALRGAPAGVDLHAALIQIEGHQLALPKLPTWARVEGVLWPARLSLEQCSSEATAAYKRQTVQRLLDSYLPASLPSSADTRAIPKGSSFADLTAGFGVDFATLAPLFDRATYVEQQASLCALARHNFPLLGLAHAEIRHATAEEVLQERLTLPAAHPYTLLLLDPARRDAAGRKVALLEDCTPNVIALKEQLRAAAHFILLKLSPMLDITAAANALAPIAEVHVVAVNGECKELLMVMEGSLCAHPREDESLSMVPIHCIDISPSTTAPIGTTSSSGTAARSPQPFIFSRSEESSAPLSLADALGPYLFEPNAALLKAGAYRLISQRYGIEKLAPSTHLYTADRPVDEFPGRQWRVIASTSFSKRELRSFLSDIPAADLTTRGFPLSTEQLRHQLRLRTGGGTHLIATTLADGKRILCQVERC